MPQNLKKKT